MKIVNLDKWYLAILLTVLLVYFRNLQHLIMFWRVILFEPLNSTKHLMIFHKKMLNISKFYSYKTMGKLIFFKLI